jgi:hypothetical protein
MMNNDLEWFYLHWAELEYELISTSEDVFANNIDPKTESARQGCQMVCFQTKKSQFG